MSDEKKNTVLKPSKLDLDCPECQRKISHEWDPSAETCRCTGCDYTRSEDVVMEPPGANHIRFIIHYENELQKVMDRLVYK